LGTSLGALVDAALFAPPVQWSAAALVMLYSAVTFFSVWIVLLGGLVAAAAGHLALDKPARFAFGFSLAMLVATQAFLWAIGLADANVTRFGIVSLVPTIAALVTCLHALRRDAPRPETD
jgi:hypothetical protein